MSHARCNNGGYIVHGYLTAAVLAKSPFLTHFAQKPTQYDTELGNIYIVIIPPEDLGSADCELVLDKVGAAFQDAHVHAGAGEYGHL